MASHVVTESLFKKYRPRSWDDMVGQDKLVDTLRNAVIDNHVSSAYLFAGPRGTGKTSSAFILAKALNCPNVDAEGNPCNHCEVCLSIDSESCLGFHYITAAEKNSVQDTREIIGQARRMSPGLKRQVFLLDEVQNWAKSGGTAFEPFLHVLEETDLPSVFIFCTTEPNKIPQTIRSRVQSFKFTMVDRDDLMDACVKALTGEGFQIVDNADKPPRETGVVGRNQLGSVIIAAGYSTSGGSVRDTLSRLEEFIGSSSGTLTNSSGSSIMKAVVRRADAPAAIKLINDAIRDGEDPRTLTSEIIDGVRGLLMYTVEAQSTGREKKEIQTMNHAAAQDRRPTGLKDWTAKHLSPTLLCDLIELYGEASANMSWSTDPQVYLETASIRAARMVRKYVVGNARKQQAQRQ